MAKFYRMVLVLLMAHVSCFAQIDTEFWFAPPEMTSGHGDSPLYLRISTQDKPATITVTQPARGNLEIITVTLDANVTRTINLTNLTSNIETIYPDVVMDTGLRITASAPITAYYEQGSTFNAEIFVLKGKNALGNHFIIPWQTIYDNSPIYSPAPYASFDVVATENNTVVTVYPTLPIQGHEGDSVIRVKLNKGETYSFKKPSSLAAANLVGTVVKSTKPIAITVKDDSVVKNTCHDALGDQLVPVKVAGKEYIVPKGFLNAPEYLFIMATEDNTDVFVSGINVPVRNLNTGQFYSMTITLPSIYIRANKPVFVLHVTGFGCEVGMAVLPPITCTGSKKISFTRSTDEFFGMNILARKEAISSFKLIRDGLVTNISPGAFTQVIGTDDKWYSAQLSYNSTEVPVNQATTIANDLYSFQVGIINGNATTTCRYGYFSSYSTLFIGDDFALCDGNTATIDAGPGKETYLWSTGATTQSIDVADPGDYWVRITREDCTLYDTLHVDVRMGHEDLGPDVEICPNAASNIDGGQNFSWLWSDGSTGQYLRTNVIGKYWVNVVDDYGCEASDTIMVNAYDGVVDALVDVRLDNVSVDTAKQENIEVTWTVVHPEKIPDNTVSVYKRPAGDSQWQLASAIDDGILFYANPGNATADNSYEFYVALADHCLTEQRQSLIHNSILLSGLPDSVNDVISLKWNAYIEWPKGVEKYEVWRKLDQDTIYSFVAYVAGTETNFSSQIGADGFVHNYLVRAIEKEGSNKSWSNKVAMEFTHPITVPNVFTPNGDGFNQYFFIPKIELYEDAELSVVDRWGKSVYRSNGYKNDWDGDDLSSGVYYYVLDLKKRNTVIKGIVNIVK
ncbi:MAG TPA: gliding motility-associated C-terminal domain-containing protein [Chryseolinea sp.]